MLQVKALVAILTTAFKKKKEKKKGEPKVVTDSWVQFFSSP